MKERTGWANKESQQGISGSIRVEVTATGRKSSQSLSNMYVRGGVQGFTVDYLESRNELEANILNRKEMAGWDPPGVGKPYG